MHIALKAWDMMRGLDWHALPIIAEALGVTDIEMFIEQLITIRESNNG
jgi:hypothetical protein